jgi:hypothetical protein
MRPGNFVGCTFDLVCKLHPVVAAAGQQAANQCANLACAQYQDLLHRLTSMK